MTTAPDIRALAGSTPSIPAPRFRWATRVGLPVAILAIAGGLLAYAARAALWPRIDVWVVPAIVRQASTTAPGTPTPATAGPRTSLAQAPGWIEPDPFAINVAALTEGVVKDVLVLEGQPVKQDQVVVRLIDEDAKLAAERSSAELAAMQADLVKARADADAAVARAAEIKDELTRKRPLLDSGGISAGQLARLELRASAADKEAEAFRASVAVAEANVRRHEVACSEARLVLARTEVRSPASGVVLARLVEPGSRLSMNSRGGAAETMAGAVLRIYDPTRLQVRADIPLADASKVAVDTEAEIITEALPGRTFHGKISRLIHEADIQRNTVQVKVHIDNPEIAAGGLKPEMLCRVRFFGAAAPAMPSMPGMGDGVASSGPGPQLLIPANAPFKMMGTDMAHVWIVDRSGSGGPVASERQLTVARAESDRLLVLSGLNPGDRVIVDPPTTLTEGSRLRVLGEKPN